MDKIVLTNYTPSNELGNYIDDLKDRLDIIDIGRKLGLDIDQYGKSFCFEGHDNKTRSLTFYRDSRSYHCFGCGAHGDSISLVQQVRTLGFKEALHFLADQANVKPFPFTEHHDARLFEGVSRCLETAADFYAGKLDAAIPYLNGRGISEETAEYFHVGYADQVNDLALELMSRGFDHEILSASGLVKEDGNDYFQKHVVIPIMNRGRVVDFYGRSLDENASLRHWRLPNNRYKVGNSLFNWNTGNKEVILVEGVFDALSLIENGFPNAVATWGKNGTTDRHLAIFRRSKLERVYVCYDGDDVQSEATLKLAGELESFGIGVRVGVLPKEHDPNSFLQSHSKEAFQQILDASRSPFECKLHHIQGLPSRQDQLEAVIAHLIPRVADAEPLFQPELMSLVGKSLDIPAKTLKEQLKRFSEKRKEKPQSESMEVKSGLIHINPALDFVLDKTVMIAPKWMVDAGSGMQRLMNTVITSDRERFPLNHADLMEKGFYAPGLEKVPAKITEERYSAEAIDTYLYESIQTNIYKTFEAINGAIRTHIDFSDDRLYDYVSCWIIGTYFYPLFSHYPYLHFTGPKGSGKSQCLQVLRCLCHNAKIAGSMTLAVQFRLIEALRPTLLFDEMENLGQTQNSELHRMLKYGFERNGPEVWRMDTNGNESEMSSWGVYCPRAFASIEGMETVIASRSVEIIMERSFKEAIKNKTVNSEDPMWQSIRDQLFLTTMTYGSKVREMYSLIDYRKPSGITFSGRDWDIFKGILAVAKTINEDLYTRIITFAGDSHNSKVARDNDSCPDMIILSFLAEEIKQTGWYELGYLHEQLCRTATGQGLDLNGAMTREKLGKRLRALKVIEDTKRTNRDNTKLTSYKLDPKLINEKLDNHRRG